MADTTYNGWTNRETWLVGVHDIIDYELVKEALEERVERLEYLGNGGRPCSESEKLPWQKDLPFVRRIGYRMEDKSYVAIAVNDALGGEERALTLWLSDWLKDYHEDFLYDILGFEKINSYIQDFTNFDRINWLEIAEHYEEEIKEALSKKESV